MEWFGSDRNRIPQCCEVALKNYVLLRADQMSVHVGIHVDVDA